MSEEVKSKPKLKLTGVDSNAFAILGAAIRVMKQHGCTDREIESFKKEATSGDYDHLLQTVMEHVDVS